MSPFRKGLHLLKLGHVSDLSSSLAALRLNFIDKLGQGCQRAPGNQHLRPSFCKSQSRLPSDPTVGPHDHNDLLMDWF